MDNQSNLALRLWEQSQQHMGGAQGVGAAKQSGLVSHGPSGEPFGQLVGELASSVGRSQKGAEAVIKRVAQGTDGEVHESMMAIEKGSITLKFGMTCLKKAIEAYKDMTTRVS